MKKSIAGIYKISCTVNKKCYIGHSKGIYKRWLGHKDSLRHNHHKNSHMQADWNVYGEDSFTFEIIESLPSNLSKEEYEEIETKWVMFYKSHLSEFGYNAVLPGSIPLYRQEENLTNHFNQTKYYVCIKENEIVTAKGRKEILLLTGISYSKIGDLCSYWKGIGKRKSLNGWMIVREENYDPEFDYINYRKPKKEDVIKKTWRDYYNKERYRKSPEDIVPYSERNLKRIPIIAVDISTGEEKTYSTTKSCNKDFSLMKVRKCINAPFGKYKHRRHYFKKAELKK